MPRALTDVPVVQRGTVAELHGLDPFAGGAPSAPAVWWCDPVDAAIVLGSRQSADVLDADAVRRNDLAVVHRRSGGGAVLIEPASVVWLDLVVPTGEVSNDVRGSMIWAGERWRDALVAHGVPADRLTVHTGAMVSSAWSDLVCFSGLGPGEVLLGDRKLVGLSQRRTKWGARIQGQIHRASLAEATAALFAPPLPSVPLADVAVWPTVDPAALAASLAASLAETVAAGERPPGLDSG